MPGENLPPYTYVPGQAPHPVTDPAGHSYRVAHAPAQAMTWTNAWANEDFARGLALFNAGYYWEAHEAFEGLWIANGRAGVLADGVKGLIKLSAMGVKLRERNADGVRRHGLRAIELLSQFVARAPSPACWGIDLAGAVSAVETVVANAETLVASTVFPQTQAGHPQASNLLGIILQM